MLHAVYSVHLLVFTLQSCKAFWEKLECSDGFLFPWNSRSTYIQPSPFFSDLVNYLHSVSDGVSRELGVFCAALATILLLQL